MLTLTTASVKEFIQTYGPVLPATATIIAATVAAIAARAAMRSAFASEENVETAKLSMELSNRAYLALTKCSFKEFQIGRPVAFVMVFTNVGRTPARFANRRLSSDFVDKEFGDQVPKAEEREGEVTFAPQQDKSIDVLSDVVLTQQQLDALNNGTLFLYIWGDWSYEDVFGKKHETTWCLRFNKQGAPTMLSVHGYYNDMT